jgi:antitoxin FitA
MAGAAMRMLPGLACVRISGPALLPNVAFIGPTRPAEATGFSSICCCGSPGLALGWLDHGAMPVNLSIKNAPDRIVQRLRERAARHHRSLQDQLLAIIGAAVEEDGLATPADILAEVRRLGLSTPSEAVALIRADRDGR